MKTDRETPIRIIRRKKVVHGGHHGGAWKVAFADFTTSMMALFLVLWLVTQSSDVKSAIAGYFADPMGRANEFGSSVIPGTGAQAANVRPLNERQLLDLTRDRLMVLGQNIRRDLKNRPELEALAGQVEITIGPDGLRIELLEDSAGTFFESGSAAPSGRGQELLELVGVELGTLEYPLMIEGHTDATPYARHDGYSNWELSSDRANAARRILMAAGVAETRVLGVRGFAAHELKVPEHPYAARNRRVSILVAADLRGSVADSSATPADTTQRLVAPPPVALPQPPTQPTLRRPVAASGQP